MAEAPPELTVRPGYPWPRDLPQGECILTSLYDDHGQPAGIRVDHADPRILISAEVLASIMGDPTGRIVSPGATVSIGGVNRTVIYRITEYVPSVRGYIAEWPD